jgi:hypothetical protein
MAFKKGESGNPKGREKGSENKVTKEAKEIFLDTLGKHSGNIDKAFQEIFETDRQAFLDTFAKYVQYYIPKKTENSHDLNGEITQNIINLGNGIDPDKTTT